MTALQILGRLKGIYTTEISNYKKFNRLITPSITEYGLCNAIINIYNKDLVYCGVQFYLSARVTNYIYTHISRKNNWYYTSVAGAIFIDKEATIIALEKRVELIDILINIIKNENSNNRS